jgi:hypothetical protein
LANNPLDDRHRDDDGRVSQKHGNTEVGTLGQTYGDDFAKGYRTDAHLSTVLKDACVDSLGRAAIVFRRVNREPKFDQGRAIARLQNELTYSIFLARSRSSLITTLPMIDCGGLARLA